MRRLMILGAVVLLLSACSKYEIPAPEYPDGIPTDVSFSTDIQPIFDSKCLACHAGGQSPDLSPGWSYDELIEGDYVNTDDPLASPLYQVFSGTHDGRATLEETLAMLGWIIEGADDN